MNTASASPITAISNSRPPSENRMSRGNGRRGLQFNFRHDHPGSTRATKRADNRHIRASRGLAEAARSQPRHKALSDGS